MRGLLLQQAAIFLGATVPAARFHAYRLAGAAIRDANRKVRTVGIFFAACDARRLLTAAAHGSGESFLTAEQCEWRSQRAREDSGSDARIKTGHESL